jgi:phage tail-like protein
VSGWRAVDLEAPGVRVTAAGIECSAGTYALAAAAGGAAVAEPAGEQPPAAAGIGIDSAGNLYAADSRRDRVLRVDACDGSATPLPCVPLSRPGGVAVGPGDRLFVTDSGHHRIVVVDLRSGQPAGFRGTADPYGPPRPSDAPGRLNDPCDVAVDSHGFVLVAERGNRRVQRFAPDGVVDAGFWERMSAAQPRPTAPEAVAIGRIGANGEERVLVFDARPGARSRLLVFELDGTLDAAVTAQLGTLEHPPGGLAAAGGRIYVGDPARQRIVVFSADGKLLGVVPGFRGHVSGLELDALGGLIVNVGGGALVRLGTDGTVAAGTLVAGPFALPGAPGEARGLCALRVRPQRVPSGARFSLFAWPAADAQHDPPPLPATAGDGWQGGLPNAPEVVFDAGEAELVWIGLRLESAGEQGPVLERMRLASGAGAWLEQLPALYALDEANAPFLARLLALLEAGLGEQDERIDDLPLLFGADTAPDSGDAPWLDWLAGWLAFPLGDVAAPARRREAVAAAFALAGRRGTAAGLRDAIALTLGATAWVSEPGASSGLWLLDGTERLGLDTTLAAAEAQGAVLDTTATLDRAHMIGEDDFGAPLHDELAHHFCVGVHAHDVAAPGAREALERLVERERPAHTRGHVCVVEPRARVGFQARIGVDAIVGGTPGPHPGGAGAQRADVVGTTRLRRRGGLGCMT